MGWRLKRAVTRWLRFERLDRPEEAEGALKQVFARLPQAPLPAAFAERVLLRSGLAPAPRPDWLDSRSWAVRAVMCVSLLLAGVSVVFLPGALPSLLGVLGAVDMAALGLDTLVEIFQRLGTGLVAWQAVSGVGESLAGALGPGWISGALILSVGAFFLLYQLTIPERSPRHAGSI